MRANLNLEEGKLEKIRIQKEEIKSEIDEITNKIIGKIFFFIKSPKK